MAETLSELLDREAIAVGLEVESAEEAIRHLAARLQGLGRVRTGYAEAVVAREKKYPTGLPLGHDINVAVPHTDPEYVIAPAIALATLMRPVEFANMEDGDDRIAVGIVFMLALNDKDRQIDMLQQVIATIQNRETIESLLAAKTVDEVLAQLRQAAT